ncbi:hypothetical protein [Ascidiimonas sp. W6]|uniref:hypothetical protein n=1 Tax=Ascidiimonas meishanensis TaxID=3128903 RepID=UPI0030ED0A52
MSNKKENKLLRLNRFTIAKLNVKSNVKGGATFTDEDKISRIIRVCVNSLGEEDNLQ